MALDAGGLEPGGLEPGEFCALQRSLTSGMTLRKKRNIRVGPIQDIKLRLLAYLEEAAPTREGFRAALAEAVQATSEGAATGPAQAVASDLEMDWQMACTSPSYVAWLRQAGAPRPVEPESPQPDSNR